MNTFCDYFKRFWGFGSRVHAGWKIDPGRQLTENEVIEWCKEDGHWCSIVVKVSRYWKCRYPHIKKGYYYLYTRYGKKRSMLREIKEDYRVGRYEEKFPLCCVLWFQLHINIALYLSSLAWVNALHSRLQHQKEKKLKKDWNYWACPLCVLLGRNQRG